MKILSNELDYLGGNYQEYKIYLDILFEKLSSMVGFQKLVINFLLILFLSVEIIFFIL